MLSPGKALQANGAIEKGYQEDQLKWLNMREIHPCFFFNPRTASLVKPSKVWRIGREYCGGARCLSSVSKDSIQENGH